MQWAKVVNLPLCNLNDISSLNTSLPKRHHCITDKYGGTRHGHRNVYSRGPWNWSVGVVIPRDVQRWLHNLLSSVWRRHKPSKTNFINYLITDTAFNEENNSESALMYVHMNHASIVNCLCEDMQIATKLCVYAATNELNMKLFLFMSLTYTFKKNRTPRICINKMKGENQIILFV